MAFIQFELWKDCNNNCGYCFNKYVPKKRNKKEALEYAISVLKEKNLEPGSTIGFMGGEFFGGQLTNLEVEAKFYELVELVLQKINTNPLGRFCIMSSLMAKDSSDWFEFCDFVHDRKMDKSILVCTSWDKLYRFNDETLKIWEDTVRKTQELYPDMRIHVEMILTEYLIKEIEANPMYLREFEQKWNCRVDFNIPYLPLWFSLKGETKESFNNKYPDFFPKRSSFLNLLKSNNTGFDLQGISNHSFHSSELYYAINDIDWIHLPFRDKMATTCITHSVCNNCCGYIDSTVKIQDDIKAFLRSFA